MSLHAEEPENRPHHNWWNKKIFLLVVAVFLALGVWGVVQSLNRTAAVSESGATDVITSTPADTTETAAAPGATAPGTDQATAPGTNQATAPATDPKKAPASAPATQADPAPVPAPTPAPAVVEPPLSNDAALAAVPQAVAPPVALSAPATVKSGLSAKVTNISAVQGEAVGIGEIAGPAIKFTLEVTNNTGADVSTSGVAVTLEYGEEAIPAAQLSGPGTADFPLTIAKDKSATATYVFNVPVDERGLVRILLSLDASLPIAAFEGAL